MRSLGKIKWYGGYNHQTHKHQNFGFITPLNLGQDLFVHESSMHGIDDPVEDMPVSFDSVINARSGRLEARSVRLFTPYSDPQMVKLCIESDDPIFWRPVFTLCLDKLPVSEASLLATKKVATLTCLGEKTSLALSLSDAILLYSDFLRELLPFEKRLQVLLKAYVDLPPDNKMAVTGEIKQCLKNIRRDSLAWTNVPAAIRLAPDIWPLVPHNQRVSIFKEEVVFDAKFPENFHVRWRNLSNPTKMLLLFKFIKQGDPLPDSVHEEDILVKAILQLYEAVCNKEDKADIFQSFHTSLQSYVIDQAWSGPDPLNFFPLLPDCLSKKASGVEYCEARAWPAKGQHTTQTERVSRAFCPRLDRACVLFEPGMRLMYSNQGARLYSESQQEWYDWSLLEVFETLKINPLLPELQSSNDYIQKISGWINRLNEIRERLKCSVCNHIMPPNYKYAKNLARYNMTVVTCEHGNAHDSNIYLNHCWGCEKVIDSRESRIRVEGFYICIQCGSGPLSSQSYKQGDICPKCGTPNMRHDRTESPVECTTAKYGRFGSSASVHQYTNKIRVCSNQSCMHKIRLPAERKRTGQQHSDYEHYE